MLKNIYTYLQSEWNVPSFHIDQWFSQFDKRFGLSIQHLFDYHSRLKTIEYFPRIHSNLYVTCFDVFKNGIGESIVDFD